MTALAFRPMTAEEALRANNLTGEQVMRLARRIALDYLQGHGATLTPHRLDELVSFLTEHALRAIIRYDPQRVHLSYGTNGGNPVSSWLADIMEQRCTDWYRSKAEGNGDRRYGNDNRITLTAMTGDDPDPDVDFEALISARRMVRWQQAALLTEWTFTEWVCITLDRAAKDMEGAA